MADFRPCYICLFNSQARIKSIIIKALKKPFLTFARLRYFLGGLRPRETTNHTLFLKKLVQNA
jgi:hypothetical protein